MTKIIANKIIDCDDSFQKEEIVLNFNRISTLMPDYYGIDVEPCFRIDYFDEDAGYDKVIYVEANFKVS